MSLRAPLAFFVAALVPLAAGAQMVVGGCPVFPNDNIWNVPVTDLPVHARSAAWIASIGTGTGLHMDFGSGIWPPGDGGPIGIPFDTAPPGAPTVSPTVLYDDESDPGPYPITTAPIEGGPNSDGDRHILVVDEGTCSLYETWCTWPPNTASGSLLCGEPIAWCATAGWCAGSAAVFDLASNALRPDGWTSADAAGLPVLPGLVSYEEVAQGEIRHAIRFTAATTQQAYLWPARHQAGSTTDPKVPPMGARFRLKAGFDTSGFSPDAQVILEGMKRFGLILADNGSDWYISGAPSESWDNDVLHELDVVQGSDFEAIDAGGLMLDPDSGATPHVFSDGFESGGSSWWSSTAP